MSKVLVLPYVERRRTRKTAFENARGTFHSPAPRDVFFVVRRMAYATDRSTPLLVVPPLIVLLSQDAHVVMAHRFSPKVSLG